MILRIAIQVPVYRLFDYLPIVDMESEAYKPGIRVQVPFGNKSKVGLLIEVSNHSNIDPKRLKPISRILDVEPILPETSMQLLAWALSYYHYYPGEVYFSAFPNELRKGVEASHTKQNVWCLTEEGRNCNVNSLKTKAARQGELLEFMQKNDRPFSAVDLLAFMQNWRSFMSTLRNKGLVYEKSIESSYSLSSVSYALNQAQSEAVANVTGCLDQYHPFLLEGVTGSGKTEVYLKIAQQLIEEKKQILLLVPEIGLIPQMQSRIEKRFGIRPAVMHSGINSGERIRAWLRAQDGSASIVLGTRLAVFCPMRSLGLIIVDEEHDLSYKQQDGFKYSARDVAIMRAYQQGIPIVLGSATPSFECLYNVSLGKYKHLVLPERAGTAVHPQMSIVDLRPQPMVDCFSNTMIKRIDYHLQQGNQVLLFLNRRGYAPCLFCHACGWIAKCKRCDAQLIVHHHIRRLQCHHCGADHRIYVKCPECGNELTMLGFGTERAEMTLKEIFNDREVIRIDRDSMRKKGSMEKAIRTIKKGAGQILLGTQMLAKGHHFPNVTLVGIVNADQYLYSVDFRSSERLGQLLTQVAGRAGRGEKQGEVMIQTHHPHHPLLHVLLSQGYAQFAQQALEERQRLGLPPYKYWAMIKSEAVNQAVTHDFLNEARKTVQYMHTKQIVVLGPVPALMEKKAGRYRAHLLIQSSLRNELHHLISKLISKFAEMPSAKKVRWSVDIDPLETT